MKPTLDQVMSFFEEQKELCQLMHLCFFVHSQCDDDGYSYCPSYPMIGVKYYLPIFGWQYFDSFSPKEIFNSKYFDKIWNMLPEVEESVFNFGKHMAFDELIKNNKEYKEKQSMLKKLSNFNETEISLLKKYLIDD